MLVLVLTAVAHPRISTIGRLMLLVESVLP